MFIIQKRQIDALSEAGNEQAVKKLETFVQKNYPQWVQGKTENEIRELCTSVCRTGNTHGIYKTPNLEILLRCAIEFNTPLNDELKKILNHKDIDESMKCEHYFLALASERFRMKKITAL